MKAFVLAFCIMLSSQWAYCITEKEYAECVRIGTLKTADTVINEAWKNLKKVAPKSLFNVILSCVRKKFDSVT